MRTTLSTAALGPICTILLAGASYAQGSIWTVDPSGGGDFTRIQAAIQDVRVVQGDTVLVLAGTYNENLDFLGKGIRVVSEKGALATVVDGGFLAPVVTFSSGETRAAVLEGFTLTKGRGRQAAPYSAFLGGLGAGVFVDNMSSPSIVGNRIEWNLNADIGAGIACINRNSNPLISRNRISRNRSDVAGGGVFIGAGAMPEIVANIIQENDSDDGGAFCIVDGSDALVHENTIAFNRALDDLVAGTQGEGGGFYIGDSSPHLWNNIIHHNEADDSGGGIHCDAESTGICSPILEFNTISKNIAIYGGGVHAEYDASPIVRNSIVHGNSASWGDDLRVGAYSGGGSARLSIASSYYQSASVASGSSLINLGGNVITSTFPGFNDTAVGDFHLIHSSPCKDLAWGTSIPVDFEGNARSIAGGPDMGADEYGPVLYADQQIVPGIPAGQWLSLNVVGEPSDPVSVAWSARLLTSPRWTPFGWLFLADPYHTVYSGGFIPSSGILDDPALGDIVPSAAIGTAIFVQALVGTVLTPALTVSIH